MRASYADRPNRWQHARVLMGYEICELCYALPILPLLVQSFGSIPQMLRVCMAALVVHLTPVLTIPLNRQRQVPRVAQGIFHTGRIYASEFIGEAKVDVVEKPGAVRAIVLYRIERLHDVLLASLTVLGSRG